MIGELFDPKSEFFVKDRMRPHWSLSGAIVFITFRTRDSIPRDVVRRWTREKNDWLDRRSLRNGRMWHDVIGSLDEETRKQFNFQFNRQRENFLDTCCGRCVMRQPELAKIVADSLMHFDGDRYSMGDFVVMANHVHLLAAFATPESLAIQCDSWLHYTATKINKKIGFSGHFWQQEPFDHLVRNEYQYEYLRRYIKDNPRKAKLAEGEYYYRRHPS